MFHKHNNLWSGRPKNVHFTQHRIEIITGARISIFDLCVAGQKTRELEKFEVGNQLEFGVIEKLGLEWAAPLLFA